MPPPDICGGWVIGIGGNGAVYCGSDGGMGSRAGVCGPVSFMSCSMLTSHLLTVCRYLSALGPLTCGPLLPIIALFVISPFSRRTNPLHSSNTPGTNPAGRSAVRVADCC